TVPELIQALIDQDPFARYAAIKALNRIGTKRPGAWSEIVKGLARSDPRIREGVSSALRETYHPRLVEALAARFSERTSSTETREAALWALASLHHKPTEWK